jgi:ABC-2 type transport system ATP-binding protein
MIEIKNLSKKFGFFTAVDNISFQVSKGEVVGFLGPNGAGKSTTMKIITGYYSPTSGYVLINDTNVEEYPKQTKTITGYLPENVPVYKEFTVLEFLKFCGAVRGLRNKELANAMDRVITLCDLKKVIYQTIDTLSKGYTKRVCLAQAIIHDPAYLILDEPTDGLDPNQKEQIHNLIKEMGKTKTILLSTHVLDEAENCCSRIIIISEGKIAAEGTPAELKAKTNKGSLAETFKEVTLKCFEF